MNDSAAVSLARMPSFFSLRVTSKPGVPFITTNDLIPAGPRCLSTVAQTTTPCARMPVVTKIFSPLMTQCSPSRRALVWIAFESEPQPGSVMAIESAVDPQRSFCSGVPAACSAALPRASGRLAQRHRVAPAGADAEEHLERGRRRVVGPRCAASRERVQAGEGVGLGELLGRELVFVVVEVAGVLAARRALRAAPARGSRSSFAERRKSTIGP